MRADKRGFTLIELIVSLAVTMIMAIIAFSFVEGMVGVWNEADRNLVMESNANAALDMLSADLEEAVFREGHFMFAADVLSDGSNSGRWDAAGAQARPVAGSFDPVSDTYGWAGTWLRFFTAAESLNAVSYQIVRLSPMSSSTTPSYNLYRSVARSDLTVQEGLDLNQGAYADNTIAGSTTEGDAVEIIKPDGISTLLNNVIDFGVRLFVYDPTEVGNEHVPDGMRIIFPADPASNALSNADSEHLANTGEGTDWGSRYPQAAEIALRVLDDDGAELLYELEEGGGSDAEWQAIVDEHSRVYRRFVDIQGRSI